MNDRVETLLDELTLCLTGVQLDGADKPPKFRIYVKDNIPGIRVTTNLPMDRGNNHGRIDIPFIDQIDAITFLESIRYAAKTLEKGGEFSQVILGHPFISKTEGRAKEPKPMGAVKITRDENGVLRMAVSSYDRTRPTCEFQFLPGRNEVYFRSKSPAGDKTAISNIVAVAMVNWYIQCLGHHIDKTYAKPAWMTNNNGGGNGGYNGNNNNQRNNQQSNNRSTNNFDDIL